MKLKILILMTALTSLQTWANALPNFNETGTAAYNCNAIIAADVGQKAAENDAELRAVNQCHPNAAIKLTEYTHGQVQLSDVGDCKTVYVANAYFNCTSTNPNPSPSVLPKPGCSNDPNSCAYYYCRHRWPPAHCN